MSPHELFRLMGDTDSSSEDIIVRLENQSVLLPTRNSMRGFSTTRLSAHQIQWHNLHWSDWIYHKIDRGRVDQVPVVLDNGMWQPTKQYMATLNEER